MGFNIVADVVARQWVCGVRCMRCLWYRIVCKTHFLAWCAQDPSPRLRRFIPSAATAAVAAGAEDVGGFDFVHQARGGYVETDIDSIQNTVLDAQSSEYRLPINNPQQMQQQIPTMPQVPYHPNNGSRGATPRGFNSSAPRGFGA